MDFICRQNLSVLTEISTEAALKPRQYFILILDSIKQAEKEGGVTRSDQCEAFLLKARDYIL